ncbi:MAG: hypothetical protein HYY16_18165 [Planctomycetes bacterium]|nr:hypothetical protein [Planctomycetota bacterium]
MRHACLVAALAVLLMGCSKKSSDDVPPANAAPVNTVPGIQATDEDTTLVFSGTISIADDAGSNPVQVTLTGTNGLITLSGMAGLTFTVGDGTADATMTFTGIIADINAALNGVSFAPTPGFGGAGSVQIVTDDQGNTGTGGPLTDTDTVAVTINAVNDTPVNTVPGAQVTDEDTTLVFSGTIAISDDAGSNPVQVTLAGTNGTITLSGTAGLTFTAGDGTADATMTFTGTVTDINTALNGLGFLPTPGFSGAADLQIVTNDQGNTGTGGPLSDTDSVAITVNAINDAPVNGVPGAQVTDEDTTFVFSGGSQIVISDDDAGGSPIQVTLTIANGVMTLAGTAGLTFTAGDGAADATMTFTGTIGDIIVALDGLSFVPASNFSGAADLQIVTDDQGNTGAGGPLSDTDTVTITVNSVSFNGALKSFNGNVNVIVPAGDGSGDVYVGGDFTTYRSESAPRLVRLNADGSVDAGFAVGTGFESGVNALALAEDGSGDVYVGGWFTTYQGIGASRIVRLNSDGTRDAAFAIGGGFSGVVNAIATAGDGSGDVYAAGDFISYQGSGAVRIIRLNSDGSADAAFVMGAGFDTLVLAVAAAGDGSGDIYAGGMFTTYQGAGANRIIRLNSDGSADAGFALGTGFNNSVYTIEPAGDGSGDVYVGGWFNTYQGAAADRIVRLNSDGSADAGFAIGSGFNSPVEEIAVAGDGSWDIYVVGNFTSYQAASAPRVARLNSDGSLDGAFAPGTGLDANVLAVAPAVEGSGDVYVGGLFTMCQVVGADRIARLNSDGSADMGFAVGGGLETSVLAVAPAGSGDVYVGGWFTRYQGSSANAIVRLNPDGSRDTAFAVGTGFWATPVRAIAPAVDGSGDVYVGGDFTTYQGVGANRIIRLNSDGSADAGFAVGTGFNSSVYAIVPAGDGSGDVYVGGNFTTYQGAGANRIIRLNSDGSAEGTFTSGTGFNSTVLTIARAPGGSTDIYVGGWFGLYQGAAAERIIRLNEDGSADAGFATGTGFNSAVYAMATPLFGSMDVYVVGDFTTYQGAGANRIIRVNADGSPDAGFAIGTGFSAIVYSIVSATDGSGDYFVGGNFTSYQATTANRLIRLNSNGSIDGAFAVGTGANSTVYALGCAADSSGDLYVGGLFTSYQAATVDYVVKVTPAGAGD